MSDFLQIIRRKANKRKLDPRMVSVNLDRKGYEQRQKELTGINQVSSRKLQFYEKKNGKRQNHKLMNKVLETETSLLIVLFGLYFYYNLPLLMYLRVSN